MKSSTKNMKLKQKCPHKLSKSPSQPKAIRYYTTNSENFDINTMQTARTKAKQQPLKNDENHNYKNFELCKEATLCYQGLKEVIRMEALENESKNLRKQNKKLKEQNMIYGEYFRQFEARFKDQKEDIKKLKEQNLFLKTRNAKVEQLNSTLSGNTQTARSHSHKQSLTTRSIPKYMN